MNLCCLKSDKSSLNQTVRTRGGTQTDSDTRFQQNHYEEISNQQQNVSDIQIQQSAVNLTNNTSNMCTQVNNLNDLEKRLSNIEKNQEKILKCIQEQNLNQIPIESNNNQQVILSQANISQGQNQSNNQNDINKTQQSETQNYDQMSYQDQTQTYDLRKQIIVRKSLSKSITSIGSVAKMTQVDKYAYEILKGQKHKQIQGIQIRYSITHDDVLKLKFKYNYSEYKVVARIRQFDDHSEEYQNYLYEMINKQKSKYCGNIQDTVLSKKIGKDFLEYIIVDITLKSGQQEIKVETVDM
ncbi:hypothetical protein TTHERM_01002670 (macronuclear) [Tetrahymena thermophila SB210]|uniref:Uncharacterized protein n=1 Tax=Tetrahymena thermophila (strain SB210) TaxID=312017 RepID=Q22D51_TETTS|nr:hypothetical protein TTHERM_01002670 [Tetrahymena thermophila SB210]EAR83202.3 hypothetical protein TTHERM_01002670 [Tetrahymena thermophila SB210]|eukprot:XP_001030865.3 hypothetical protein TTHERM_01002670 [Tetrahymena thermophila SB210]